MSLSKKSNRPRLAVPRTVFDKVLELIGIVIIASNWIYIFMVYDKLPTLIPGHYNFIGEADRMGSKAEIFFAPVIFHILYIVISILNRYPHHFNYVSKITEENALRLYTTATKGMRYMKLLLAVLSFVITYQTVHNALNEASGIGCG